MAGGNSPETKLWLIRHPEPEVEPGTCYGSLDLKLSPRGLEHASEIASALASEPFAAIYTSPLERCWRMAEILASGRTCPVKRVDALREMDLGECEGCQYEDLAERYPDIFREWLERPASVRFPGGETFLELRERALGALREILARHAGQTVAMVTHAGVVRAILADTLGIAPDHLFRLGQRYGGVSMIRYLGEAPIVELMNASYSHLVH
jgi:alpha-ribazole phosphatase